MSQLKKRKLKLDACYLCQKDNKGMGCDGGRPCQACRDGNVPHLCFGMEIGSGRETSTAMTEEPIRGNHIFIEPDEPPAQEDSAASMAPEFADGSHQITEEPPVPVTASFRTNFPSLSSPFAGRGMSGGPRPAMIATTFSTVQPDSKPKQPDAAAAAPTTQHSTPTQSSSNEIPNKQNNLNLYFMKELCKLKNDQKRLDEQLSELRLENSNLSTTLKNSQFQVMRLMEYFTEMAERQQQHVEMHPSLVGDRRFFPALPLSSGRPSDPDIMQISPSPESSSSGSNRTDHEPRRTRAEQPMVVYDISKHSATVLTANSTFCELLGYEMNEVIGMPWNKFIPPDAVARTMEILRQTDLNSVFQVEQVYRHKTSGVFTTWDTHTILFGPDGTPVSDVVVLHLPGQAPARPPPNASLSPLIAQHTNSSTASPAMPSTLLAPQPGARKYIGWKKKDGPNAKRSYSTNRKNRKNNPTPTSPGAKGLNAPPSSTSPPPPSGLYPLTPMPVSLCSKPQSPNLSSLPSTPTQPGAYPLFTEIPSFPDAVPLQTVSVPTSPAVFPDIHDTSSPGVSIPSPYFFPPLHEDEDDELPDLQFQRVSISNPSPSTTQTTTTTTMAGDPVELKSIADEDASMAGTNDLFHLHGDDVSDEAALDTMDVESIMKFLNMG